MPSLPPLPSTPPPPPPPPSFHSLQHLPHHHDPAFKLFGQTIPVSSLPIDHDDRSATTSQDSQFCATTSQEEDEELDVGQNSVLQTRRTTTMSFTSTTSNTDHQELQDEEMMRIIPTSGKRDPSHRDELRVGNDTDGEEDSSVVSTPTSAIICTDNYYIEEGGKGEAATMQTTVDDSVEEEEEMEVVIGKQLLGESQVVHSDAGMQVLPMKKPDKPISCPRCQSLDTKFCYYNNYNVNQPRHFCKGCQRYWTAGGTLRNVPVGAGRRKSKQTSTSNTGTASCRTTSADLTTAAADVVNHVNAQPITNPPPSSSDVSLINNNISATRSRAVHHSSCADFPLTSSAAAGSIPIASHSSSSVYEMNRLFGRADPSGGSINLADRSLLQPPSMLYNTSSIICSSGPASSSTTIPNHFSFDRPRDKVNDSVNMMAASDDPMVARQGHDQMAVLQQQQQDGRPPSGDHMSWMQGKFPTMLQQQQQKGGVFAALADRNQRIKDGATINHDVKMSKGASTELQGVAATANSKSNINVNASDNRTSTTTAARNHLSFPEAARSTASPVADKLCSNSNATSMIGNPATTPPPWGTAMSSSSGSHCNATFPFVVNNNSSSNGAWPMYGTNLWAPPPIHDGSAAPLLPNYSNFPAANATSGPAQLLPSSMYNNGWPLAMASPWPLIQGGAMWPVPYCTAMWAMQWAAAASVAAAAAATTNPPSSSLGTANAAAVAALIPSSSTNSAKGHNLLQEGMKQQEGWKRRREEEEQQQVEEAPENEDTNPMQQQQKNSKMERIVGGGGTDGVASSSNCNGGGNGDDDDDEGEAVVVPKTLRIGDPEAAAQSSIWAKLQGKRCRVDGYGMSFGGDGMMFGDLRESKVFANTNVSTSACSSSGRAGTGRSSSSKRNHGDGDDDNRVWNPAAARRSSSFQERNNLPCGPP